jgi:glycosyltransferase involved in cell wall biosynthesis
LISVVIRTKNEADRLRLTIQSLASQIDGHELIIVNDGSTDHTLEVIKQASESLAFTVIHHPTSLGRSAASNAGGFAARGDLILFMDGDTLACPHLNNPNCYTRGQTRHLRSTRTLLDPQQAIPYPEYLASALKRSTKEIDNQKITSEQITNDFDSIDQRSGLGIYPGIHPEKLSLLEIKALTSEQNDSVMWAAASGHNFSMPKKAFLDSQGFDTELTINEHRELALKLSLAGYRHGYINHATTYHLTHRSGWRDPLTIRDWEERFLELHPFRSVALLSIFWATIANADKLPKPLQIPDFESLEKASRNLDAINYDEARSCIGLPTLGVHFWQR